MAPHIFAQTERAPSLRFKWNKKGENPKVLSSSKIKNYLKKLFTQP